MKNYIYPQNKFESLRSKLFDRNLFLSIGASGMLLFVIGFLFVLCTNPEKSNVVNFDIDLNNRFIEPTLFHKIKLKNDLGQNNKVENTDLVQNVRDEVNLNNDDFLFSDSTLLKGDKRVESSYYDSDSNLIQYGSTVKMFPQKQRLFLFGTNSEGRDLFSNLFLGLELYLIGGLISLLVALTLGTIIGSSYAYYSNTVLAKIAKFLEDIISSFPKIIILFIVLIVFDIGLIPIMITIGIMGSTKISNALAQKIYYLKKHEFIDSAKQLGLSHLNILVRHILYYNCRDIFIVYGVYILADTILLESTLAYLNFGAEWVSIFQDISIKSWGMYLAEGKSYLSNGAYWITLFPALFIILFILSLNFIGDGLKEKYHLK